MRRDWLAIFSTLVLVLGLAACSDDEGADPDGGDDVQRGDAAPVDDTGPDLGSPDVPVQDTPQQDVPAPRECGDIDFEGTCEGSLVLWCQEEQLQEVDCATYIADPEGTGVCTYIADDFGFWCAASPGDACLFSTQDGGLDVEFCSGNEPGCLINDDGALCAENLGLCDEPDVGTCLGDAVIWACLLTQPTLLDCAADGGTCDDTAGEALCVDIGVGGPCGGDLYECAAGLDCVGATAESLGTCEDTNGGDVGADTGNGDTGDVDAGDTGDADTGDADTGDTGDADAGTDAS